MKTSRRSWMAALAGIVITASQAKGNPAEPLQGNKRCRYQISYIPPSAYGKAFRPRIAKDLEAYAPHGVEIKTINGNLLNIRPMTGPLPFVGLEARRP